MNELKQVNDTKGHNAGDEYIKAASSFICSTFKRSPVFRIGGDEFIAILEGPDYDEREALFDSFVRQMDENAKSGRAVVAPGMAYFNETTDKKTSDVLGRADVEMYQRKKQMKRSR